MNFFEICAEVLVPKFTRAEVRLPGSIISNRFTVVSLTGSVSMTRFSELLTDSASEEIGSNWSGSKKEEVPDNSESEVFSAEFDKTLP